MSFARIDDNFSRRPHKPRFSDQVNLTSGSPPPYGYGYDPNPRRRSCCDPRGWSRRVWIGVGVGLLILLIIIIVAAVVGSRANRYPAYAKLNYSLADTFQGTSFFDNFNYFVGYDPTQGFVHYVDQPGSVFLNLTFASATSAVLKVDTTDPAATTGRRSVRIESKQTYNSGLFIFDVLHSPFGCGTWPALWLVDQSNWPMNGEIDVMEATNSATFGNQMTLHTTNGCSMSVKRKEIGQSLTSNCYNGTDDNAGCGVQGAGNTFGQQFNNNGGGVYAMEWRSDGIRVWFFPRSSIPGDVTNPSLTPDPSAWPEALADFPNTDCNIGNHFRNQSIVANIDLCGTWAGQPKYYTEQSGCPGNCTDFVANNPNAFLNAFWEFQSFKVYQAA